MKNEKNGKHSLTVQLSPSQFQAIEKAAKRLHLAPERLILASGYLSWNACYGGGPEDLVGQIGRALIDIDGRSAPEILDDTANELEEVALMRHP